MATWWNDFQSSALSGLSLTPSGARNATISGTSVDMKEAQEGLFALLTVGEIDDGTHNIILEEADDAGFSSPTPIIDFRTGNPAAFAELSTAGGDNQAVALTFKRSKRFVRARTIVAGATAGGEYAVSIHGMRRRVL